jgi:hypothetical protein
MAIQTNEPRALSAALSGPAFVTAGAGMAMHVANRHVERWAPEAGASKVRSLRSLGFVDRLVAPWIETTQRSPSFRQYTSLITEGPQERGGSDVSWVFRGRGTRTSSTGWRRLVRPAPAALATTRC